jgi:hypothetical protein
MAQSWNQWNGTTLPWQNTSLPWKNTALSWNATNLPWKTNPTPPALGDGPVMDFSDEANSQLIALLADDPF